MAKKEAEKEAKEAEKEAKRLAAESAKKEKDLKSAKKAAADEDEEEPDVVKKIEFGGKKYLKSKKSGICYDYSEYVTNGEQVVIGKWNNNTNKIEFEAVAKDEEEVEEEYE